MEEKLVAKPKVQTVFQPRPKALNLDRNGSYESHERDSVMTVVKELGIRADS